MNNNRSDQRALEAGCKGTFSATSFVTFGDKSKPEPYVSPFCHYICGMLYQVYAV